MSEGNEQLSESTRSHWTSTVTRLTNGEVRKVIAFRPDAPEEEIQGYREVMEFMAEIQHPGMCRIHEGGESEGLCGGVQLSVCMEGMSTNLASLSSQSEISSPWTEQVLVENIDSLLEVLALAHAKGRQHGQVTLENILVTEDQNTFKLIGFAPIISESDPPVDRVYWSPERIQGVKRENGREDLYQLGISFLLLSYFGQKAEVMPYIESAGPAELLAALTTVPRIQRRLGMLLQLDPPAMDITMVLQFLEQDRPVRNRGQVEPQVEEQSEGMKVKKKRRYVPQKSQEASSESASMETTMTQTTEAKEPFIEQEHYCGACQSVIPRFVGTQNWTRKVLADHRELMESVCSFDCFYKKLTEMFTLQYYCHACFQHFTRRMEEFSPDNEGLNDSLRTYCSIACTAMYERVLLGEDSLGECAMCKKRLEWGDHKTAFGTTCGSHIVCGLPCLEAMLASNIEMGNQIAICPTCSRPLKTEVLAKWGYYGDNPPPVQAPVQAPVQPSIPAPKSSSEVVKPIEKPAEKPAEKTIPFPPRQSPAMNIPVPETINPPIPKPAGAPAQPILSPNPMQPNFQFPGFSSDQLSGFQMPNFSDIPQGSVEESERKLQDKGPCVSCGLEDSIVFLDCCHFMCHECRKANGVATELVNCKGCNAESLVLSE